MHICMWIGTFSNALYKSPHKLYFFRLIEECLIINDQDYDLHVVASTYAWRWSKTEIHLTLWIWGLVLSYCENTTDKLIIECGLFFDILIILSKAENNVTITTCTCCFYLTSPLNLSSSSSSSSLTSSVFSSSSSFSSLSSPFTSSFSSASFWSFSLSNWSSFSLQLEQTTKYRAGWHCTCSFQVLHFL